MKRLAIITTHPIQYNAPLFQLLALRKKIEIKVFYTWGDTVLKQKYDPGFGKVIEWDIPLLAGYDYEFLENTAADKGSHHFNGIDNPHIVPAIETFRPDAILVYGWAFKSHLKVMRTFKKKVPILFRGDSTLLDDSEGWQAIKRNLFLRWVYSFIDIALYVGTNNYAYFKKAGLKDKQLVYAPHAIDNDRFSCLSETCAKDAADLRRRYHISASDFVFLFAGKLEPKKNVRLLLEAFQQAEFDEAVHLIVVGNGPLEEQLKSIFQAPNIQFMDFQNQQNMPAVYRMADVYVLPSQGPGETWGLSVNEAMANGRAVIVSDKCGCAVDLVENGVNGFIFESGNGKQLKEVLKTISQSNGLDKMKQASVDKIRQFSLEAIAEQIETVLMKSESKFEN